MNDSSMDKLEATERLLDNEAYEPLLSTERTPSTTILVAIPANMQPGEAVSTNLLRQSSIQGTIIDVPAAGSVTPGIPVGSGPSPGHLVFLPDLPSTVQLWHNQRVVMLVWLVSSLISLVLFAPLFMASGLFLAAEIAAVMGIVASVVQLCKKELASSNTLELGAQIKLVATCGSVAFFLDAFTICLDLLMLWKLGCDPADDICMAVTKYAFLFGLSCMHHGTISYMVSKRASSIMALLNPVSSGGCAAVKHSLEILILPAVLNGFVAPSDSAQHVLGYHSVASGASPGVAQTLSYGNWCLKQRDLVA